VRYRESEKAGNRTPQEHPMNTILKNTLLAFALALLPLSLAVAQEPAAEAVCTALDEDKSPSAIIQMLRAAPYELSLEDATVTAMEACEGSNRDAFVSAGIASAENLVEAQAVASAVESASSGDSQVSQTVKAAMDEYVKVMDQPFIHHDGNIPTGGGAYDPTGTGPGGIIGGTRPPVGGTRPPVSPSS
jgi:hypothetical protein